MVLGIRHTTELTERQKKFPHLTLVQKYDAVLLALYKLSGNRPTFGRIDAFITANRKKIHWGETWDILNKMRRDGIIREQMFQTDIKGIDKEIFLITFEGKLMQESGGLRCKIWRENFTKRRIAILEVLTFVVALGTLYATCKSNNSCCENNYKLKEQYMLPPTDTIHRVQIIDSSRQNHQLKSGDVSENSSHK